MKTGDLIYGANPVREALRGGRTPYELFVQESARDHRVEKIILLAKEHGVPVRYRTRDDLTRLSGGTHHQGLVLSIEPFAYADADDVMIQDGFLLLLDGIQDPHNLGALIRSAACAGVNGVIIPADRACGITPAVEKASAGAVETVPVARVTNMVNTIQALKDKGYWVYGLTGEAGQSLFDTPFSGAVALVVGGEGEGIRPLVRKACDHLVSITMAGGVSSLNASVAGALALFEVARKR